MKKLFPVISSSHLLSKEQLRARVVVVVVEALGGRKVPSIAGPLYRGSCGYGQTELRWLGLKKGSEGDGRTSSGLNLPSGSSVK